MIKINGVAMTQMRIEFMVSAAKGQISRYRHRIDHYYDDRRGIKCTKIAKDMTELGLISAHPINALMDYEVSVTSSGRDVISRSGRCCLCGECEDEMIETCEHGVCALLYAEGGHTQYNSRHIVGPGMVLCPARLVCGSCWHG